MSVDLRTSHLQQRQWLERSIAGDATAFSELYALHIRPVYWQALRALGSPAEAEETAQDVFVLAWTKRADIRVVDHSILPWLLVTTRNLSLNRLRKIQRDNHRNAAMTTDSADMRPTPDRAVESQLLRDAIDAAVENLSEADQTLYYLCIDEGLSYKHAAASLGATHATVRNRLARIRQSLRSSLSAQKEGLL
jgi:RNA polymerase sigma factor (sigma-70 family)